MRRRLVLASSGFAAVAMVAAGCSGASDDGGGEGIQPIEVENDEFEPEVAPEPEIEPEPEAEPEPEPEAEPDDPFAFDDPSEIDVDYVDRVMAELLAVTDGLLDDVLISDVSEGLTDWDGQRLRAIFSGPRLVSQSNDFQSRATEEAVRGAFLPESRRTGSAWDSSRIILAQESCLVVIGYFDVSGTAVEPYPEDQYAMLVLSRIGESDIEEHEAVNPTTWRIHEQVQLVFGETGESVPQEEWDSLDYMSVLDVPCVSDPT